MESALHKGGRDPGLRLIETVLWDGATAPRWPFHLARLRESAARLGWPRPDPAPPAGGATAQRLRLTMGCDGATLWEQHSLPAPATEWRVAVSVARLSSADPWLSVKSSRRAIHDLARANLPMGVDEAIFLNERDEVCEGTITNIFFDRGQGLRTPPLASGLLPGVLRAELACPEEILRAEDLPKVQLWVGNALRGLIPARLLI